MKRFYKLMVLVILLFPYGCATYRESAAPTQGPGNKVFDSYLNQGMLSMHRKDYKKAEDVFKKAIDINPRYPNVHNYLGLAYFMQKNYKLAEEQFKKTVEIDPSFFSAYNNLGTLYSTKFEFEKAKAMFKQALSISPDIVSANYSLGTILFYNGEIDEANIYLSKGIALNPNFMENQGQFVVNIFSSGLDSPEINFNYARLFASTGNIEKTVEYLAKAKKAGFRDWKRIQEEKEFEKVRNDPRIKEFFS